MVILYVRSIYGSAETVKLTMGTELTLVGKELLGKVAYNTAQKIAPDLAVYDWEDLGDDDKALFTGIAVAVRGFHPDA